MRTPIFITVVNTGDKAIRLISLYKEATLYNEYEEEIRIEFGGNWEGKLLSGEEANVRISYADVPYDIRNQGVFSGVIELWWLTVDDDVWVRSIELTLEVIPQGENPLNIVAISTTGMYIMNYTVIQKEYYQLVSSYETLQVELGNMTAKMTTLESSYNELKQSYPNSMFIGAGIAIAGVAIAIAIVIPKRRIANSTVTFSSVQ